MHAEPGCSVSVAGENCSLDAPCRVRAGRKRFRLRWAQGQKTVTRELKAGTQRELTCYVERKLTIQVRREDGTSPIWGTIFVNDLEVGQIQEHVIERGRGDYRVEVRRTGYEVLDGPQTITVEPAFEEKLPPVVFRIRAQ